MATAKEDNATLHEDNNRAMPHDDDHHSTLHEDDTTQGH
jgi:hypothetical protein